jgi:glycosyltransferase involved in cell wall biosynthesis
MRNEADFVEKCALSMIEQTVPPEEWIIIDDSSDDSSSEIVEKFANSHSWIKILKTKIPGKGGRGQRIARLVNIGLEEVVTLEWDFCSKIDADIILPERYFEDIFYRFDQNDKLGIASGGCYVDGLRGLTIESVSADHTRGALKTYKSACFSDIGGIRNADGWDGIDNLQAQMKGWETQNFPEIKAHHLRKTGSRRGVIRGCIETGKIAHFMGYHPIFILARSTHRMLSFPYIFGGLAMLIGYFVNWFSMKPIFEEGETVRYLRRKQLERLRLRRPKRK